MYNTSKDLSAQTVNQASQPVRQACDRPFDTESLSQATVQQGSQPGELRNLSIHLNVTLYLCYSGWCCLSPAQFFKSAEHRI